MNIDGATTSILSTSRRHTRGCIIGEVTHRAIGTTAIDIMIDGGRLILILADVNRCITLDITSYFVTDFTFTTAIDVTILNTTLTFGTDSSAGDVQFRSIAFCSVSNTRFFTTSIDTLAYSGCAVDGEGCLTCDRTETVKRNIGMDVMLSIFICKWIRIGAVGVTPGIYNKLVVILRSLNVGIIKYVSRAVIGWSRSQKCSSIPYFNRWY